MLDYLPMPGVVHQYNTTTAYNTIPLTPGGLDMNLCSQPTFANSNSFPVSSSSFGFSPSSALYASDLPPVSADTYHTMSGNPPPGQSDQTGGQYDPLLTEPASPSLKASNGTHLPISASPISLSSSHSSSSPPSEQPRCFPCAEERCPKTFKSRSELTKHKRQHDHPVSCPKPGCPHSTAGRNDMRRHINTYHLQWAKENPGLVGYDAREIMKECGYCDHKSNRPDNLKRHIETKHCPRNEERL
ncbi:hypothetical protein BD289DRAFT_177972 [Coniella lustricola]|uniref:C2H2-type domain-containing protein n=1 Tax=Coniella lustricola TaxID=2025994 RepID=A0A2T3ADI1_9PEZI|nr:hypothetical protein BD289DRAFT_177972 [Coniella lustricola]